METLYLLESYSNFFSNLYSDFFSSKILDFIEIIALKIIIFIIILLIFIKLKKFIVNHFPRVISRFTIDAGILKFTHSMVEFGLYILFALICATFLGFPTTSIITIIGSLGLAIGLALQGNLANIAGGLMILIFKPFKLGDYILESNKKLEGTVEEINIIYTKLRTVDNCIAVIPNGFLSNSSIVNYSHYDFRKLIIKLGISYDSDIKKAKSLIEELIMLDDNIRKNMEINVYVDNLADSSVVIACYFWVETSLYWATKRAFLENIKYKFDEAGIEIPYPHLSLHMKGVQDAK